MIRKSRHKRSNKIFIVFVATEIFIGSVFLARLEGIDTVEAESPIQKVEIIYEDTKEETDCENAEEEPFTDEEKDILLRIAMAEAEGEGIKGKALVMMVVLNRAASRDFPETIKGVVFEEGQFSSTEDGGRYYTADPDSECYEALGMISSGWDESKGALYFENCESESWHSRNLELIFEYGSHRFYI